MQTNEKAYIEIRDLCKSFKTSKGDILQVLKHVDLDINKGEMFGIMGFSGAGKSTFVRCINRLEEPDSGEIIIDGVDITKLNHKELSLKREKIGMIFQTFNLFDSKTVVENIMFPLQATIKDKKARKERAIELAGLVGLSDKIDYYPAQLSGGQKQRVGIARALANEPDVILCDEATSALDPQTTLTILDLLKEINEKMGVTMILITHEISVVKYACHRAAIIEGGMIKEHGDVIDVLNNPRSETGMIFTGVENRFEEAWNERVNG